MSAAPPPARAARPWTLGKVVDLVIALVAHALVGLAWLVTAAAVMGSLGVGRRMLINSEFAYDTGRLPQPWVIALSLAAAWLAHRFFAWSMRRVTRGEARYGPVVVAWAGALLGVLWGVYNWAPPVQVGLKVGPSSGQSTPWDALGWVAYHARLWLPATVGVVTAALLVFSKHSPLVALVRRPRPPRRARARAA